MATQDPYTLVAHHLQDGEATRAELKALTDLDYAQIEAALYRLVEVVDSVDVRTDGAGIEHYRWKGGAVISEPSKTPKPAPAVASRFCISVNPEVRKLVEAMPVGAETDTVRLFALLLEAHPKLNNSDHRRLRTYIAQATSPLKGKLLTLVRPSVGKAPAVFARISSNGQKALPKSRQESDKKQTTKRAKSDKAQALQRVQPDKSLDKSESPKSSNFITTNQVASDVASFSPSNEEVNRATYALPAFIAELRAERAELDQLITLLERRMMRGGG